MNKIQAQWTALENKAWKEIAKLRATTGFEYRTTRQVNGVHIEGYSKVTGRWYTVRVVSNI